MARTDGKITPLEPGFLSSGFLGRLASGMRYAIRGVAPDNWFGPLQPIERALQLPQVGGIVAGFVRASELTHEELIGLAARFEGQVQQPSPNRMVL